METYLIHTEKGKTWKKHKYIRKEGNRYIYVENKDKLNTIQKINKKINPTDITEQNLQNKIDEYNRYQDKIDAENSSDHFQESKRKYISDLRSKQKTIEKGMAFAEMVLNANIYYGQTGLHRTNHGKLKK